jgi:formylglycine-generating enzyme required for sulfatase activity
MAFGPLSTTAYTVNRATFHMARLPPGRFMDGEGRTRRELLVSRPFEIGLTQVTQTLWRAVMSSSSARFEAEDRPVVQVSHDDVQGFLARLSVLGFTGFRLPTEAQWAWAARCGVPARWAGADRVKPVAVVDASDMEPVAGLHPDIPGLFDQSGNVFEWLADGFAETLSPGIDPRGPVSVFNRVVRGGGWGSEPWQARVVSRDFLLADFRMKGLSFRLLRIR